MSQKATLEQNSRYRQGICITCGTAPPLGRSAPLQRLPRQIRGNLRAQAQERTEETSRWLVIIARSGSAASPFIR